jgi:hypothetical protein
MSTTTDLYAALVAATETLHATAVGARQVLLATTEPTPEPEPDPVVDPPAPVAPTLPTTRILDYRRIVMFREWSWGDAYDREEKPIIATGPTLKLTLAAASQGRDDGQGWYPKTSTRSFEAAQYQITSNGAVVGSVSPAAGSVYADVTLNTAAMDPGWHLLDIEGSDESMIPLAVYVQRADYTPDRMLIVQATYGVYSHHWGQVSWAWVPMQRTPTSVPYVLRAAAPFSDLRYRKTLVEFEVVPWRHHDDYRPRLTNGVVHGSNTQSYYWYDLASSRYPSLPCLDGPRGVGTLSAPMHIQIGRNGGLYVCTSWSLVHIDPKGTLKTLLGWRHTAPAGLPIPATDATRKATCELVGDWSAIAEADRGPHELWGMAWRPSTVVIDESAAPMLNGDNGMEKPHIVGPQAFLADSQGNRILRAKFDPRSHDTPAKITVLATGQDYWDVACGPDDTIYASERGADRVVVLDPDTGAVRDVLLQGQPGLATIAQGRLPRLLCTLEQAQAQPVLRPEGLYLLDDWLYVASSAMRQVLRVNVKTRERQVVVAAAYWTDGVPFYKIAVSDGGFGPRGTVFLQSWSVRNQGRPLAYLPDGSDWRYVANDAKSSDPATYGPGLPWRTVDYGSACAVGQGRLVHGGSSEGIWSIEAAQPSDQVVTEKRWTAASGAYADADLVLTHGQGGFSHFYSTPPWGVSAAVGDYLAMHGHRQEV